MDWAQIVSQVGFPIAVAGWLLIRLDDRLGAFEKTAVAICQRLEDQTNRCSECAIGGSETKRKLRKGCEINPA